MADNQQKTTTVEETTSEQVTEVPEVADEDTRLDDTPDVAEVDPEEAEALDTSTTDVHPETPDDEADTGEVPTEEGIPDAAEAAEEVTGHPETEVEVALKKARAEAKAREAEEADGDEDDESLVEEAADAVEEGADDDPDQDRGDGAPKGRLLDEAVSRAISEMNVPTADADELIVGGEREPITSIDNPATLMREQVGYKGDVVGRVVKLEDLEGALEDEETSPEYDQLAALIEKTLTKVTEDEIVQGRVVSVGEKEVVIDFGFKSDGVIAKAEFGRELEQGDEVEVYLERIEDYHGQPVISKTKADKFRRWEKVEHAFGNEEVIEGKIIRRIKGGMIAEIFDGLEAFLPGSQIDVRPVRDFDAYLDKRMEFKIVKINPSNENVVISHKALIEKELEAQREKILNQMEVGQVLEGTVKNIVDFGVFIDLGGVDGLLHITDLSWGRVSHPSELVDLDQELKVVVLDYDKERQRISLGLKQLQPHPWENIDEKFDEGDVVEGKVVSITDYGAFVELEKGIEGLVHISEMSWTDHIRHPSQKVSLGQLVKVKILNIDNEGKKISLGMKQLEQNPWEGLSDRYPPGTVLRGKVRNITNFGVFVEIEPGIDGLVHISDLSWTKKVKHPSEMINRGQDLDVVILDIDEDRERVSLGHKQIQTNPWNDFANVYSEGSDTAAEIVNIKEKGIVVELPMEVEGFVPGSELKHGPQNFQTFYQVGQELDLRVIRFDSGQKEIILSEIAKDRAEQRERRQEEERERRQERQREDRQIQEFKEKETTGPTTLGELSGLEDLKRQMEAAEAAAAADAVEVAEAEAEAATEADEEAEAADVEAQAGEADVETPEAADAEADDEAASDEDADVVTVGDASSDLEGTPGVDNRADVGSDKAETDVTEPSAEQAQRQEEAGDVMPAEKAQASMKSTGETDKVESAEAAEAIVEDETPVTGTSEKPVAATEADVDVEEIEAQTKPGDTEERAVTKDAVEAQAEEAAEAEEEADADESEATAEAEEADADEAEATAEAEEEEVEDAEDVEATAEAEDADDDEEDEEKTS
jgi:small subunit ribosomal protein S1